MKKIALIGLSSILFVSGCATLKEPQVMGTDKANRYVDLSYYSVILKMTDFESINEVENK